MTAGSHIPRFDRDAPHVMAHDRDGDGMDAVGVHRHDGASAPTAGGPPSGQPPSEDPTAPAPRPRTGWSQHFLARLVGAALGGVALGLAFPPVGWAWLAPLAAASLTVLCRGLRVRRAALVGLVFGVGFFIVLLRWLTVIGVDAMIGLSVLQAVFLAALGAALAVVTSLRGWPLWASALWVAVELVRSHLPFGGFGWGKLAFALDETPLVSYAALGGTPTVAFLAVLAGNLVVWAVVTPVDRLQRLAALAGAVTLVVAGLFVPRPSDGDQEATAAVVQGNIPGRGMEFLGRARTVTNNHLEATRELMADVDAGAVESPDFVLWPENSTDLSPMNDEATGSMVNEAAQTVGVPLLIGSMQDGPDPATQRRNTALLYEGDEPPREVYQKRHPVPFGEYIPFRDQLTSLIDRLALIPRDMVPGDEPGVFDLGPARAGVVICFEVAWDGLVRDAAQDGSDVLVVQTNNATYLGTGQLEQQFAATRLRAIEHGKSVLVSSTSGISAVVAPDGETIAKSAEATQQVLVEEVPLRSTPTLATIVGAWPERGIAAVGGLALLLAVWRRRRRPDSSVAEPR